MAEREKLSKWYERAARREETAGVAHERALQSAPGVRAAKKLAAHYRDRAEHFRKNGQ